MLLTTQLHQWHQTRAKMVPFAGFDMPVVYLQPSSIIKEHLAVRNNAGLFDVSHMGRMLVIGKDAAKFLDILIPRDISNLPLNKVAYCYFLNESAGFRDDLTVANLGSNKYLLTYNAGNREKIEAWIRDIRKLILLFEEINVDLQIISNSTAMFAFQGPQAPGITEKLFGVYPGPWKLIETDFNGIKILIMGSGYTGESGCEIVVYNTDNSNITPALSIWDAILEYGDSKGVIPCGLGARDTLRLEAGMPLYGNDIDESTPATQTGLYFPTLVKMKKNFFIGQNALNNLVNKSQTIKRVGLITLKRGKSPRTGMKIVYKDQKVGEVTSGSFSPLLKLGIGMAYINQEVKLEETVTLVSEGFALEAKVVEFPLYDKNEYGSKRKTK